MRRAYSETLAGRLGISAHCSPLEMKLVRLSRKYPQKGAECLEDWLVDIANARGATVVRRNHQVGDPVPDSTELSNEELVVGICLPSLADRPQMLRLAAQLISRKAVDIGKLIFLAKKERAQSVLASLADAALRVDSRHPVWSLLKRELRSGRLRDVTLHWTRLAEPVPDSRGVSGKQWRLVA